MRIVKMFRWPVIFLLMTSLLLNGCAASSNGSDTLCQVYLVAKSLDTEFWQAAIAGANAASAEYNIELTVLGPETEEDYKTQNDYIAQAVLEGADALVFSAISYEENAAAVDAAAEQGVPVIVIDSDVASDKVSVRIGTDNIEAGRMAASAALDTDWPALTVGIVNYDLGSRNGQERELGLRQALEEDARVDAVYTINVRTSVEAAQMGVEELLSEYPDINVIVGLNEPLAVGAAQAVEKLGVADRVRMVGFDSNVNCIDLMRLGSVSALIVQNPYAMGYLGVEAAWELVEGHTFNSDELIDTTTTIVMQDNMFTPEGQKALFPFG